MIKDWAVIPDLDKILFIKGIRMFYDDADIDKEEFEQLYHKITKSLEFTKNFPSSSETQLD